MADDLHEQLALPSPAALTPEEQRLVDCAARGEWWEPQPVDGKNPDMDPAKAAQWHASRTIRARVIRCLVTGEIWPGRTNVWPVSTKGVMVLGAHFADALDLLGAVLQQTVQLHACAFDRQIILSGSETKTFSLQGSRLLNGLLGANAIIRGSLQLREGFIAIGETNLCGAIIERQLDCENAIFEIPDGFVLDCDGITVNTDVFFCRGFVAKGSVNLTGASIHGQLDCSDGTFEGSNGFALDCDGITVSADVFLRDGFVAKGEVNFTGASINGQFDCHNATFENPTGSALNCYAMSVVSDVFLVNGFVARGRVNLKRATIKGSLLCDRATFDNKDGDGIDLTMADIGEGFFLRDLRSSGDDKPALKGHLLLEQAKCRTYSDDEQSWPAPGKLALDGFTYERFHDCGTNWRTRRAWLELQSPRDLEEEFRPQPWTQVINVLRAMGHDDDARELAVCREKARMRSKGTDRRKRIWLQILRSVVGFGYKPWRALWWASSFTLFGWFVFATAADLGYMAPRDGSVATYLASDRAHHLPDGYTRFNAPVFALDNFLPIIELGQDAAWVPTDVQIGHERLRHDPWWKEYPRLVLGHGWTVTGGVDPSAAARNGHPWDDFAASEAWAFSMGFHRFYYWFEELAGWALASLFIAGMSGIMKRD